MLLDWRDHVIEDIIQRICENFGSGNIVQSSDFWISVGTIFKRFDTTKLFTVTCQDVVERFHLGLAMLFVIAEEMDNTTSWLPNMGLLWKCTQIFLAEIVIDVTKHAVLGKFNEIRPGVYKEYTRVSFGHRNHFFKIVAQKSLNSWSWIWIRSIHIWRILCFWNTLDTDHFITRLIRYPENAVYKSNTTFFSPSVFSFNESLWTIPSWKHYYRQENCIQRRLKVKICTI